MGHTKEEIFEALPNFKEEETANSEGAISFEQQYPQFYEKIKTFGAICAKSDHADATLWYAPIFKEKYKEKFFMLIYSAFCDGYNQHLNSQVKPSIQFEQIPNVAFYQPPKKFSLQKLKDEELHIIRVMNNAAMQLNYNMSSGKNKRSWNVSEGTPVLEENISMADIKQAMESGRYLK